MIFIYIQKGASVNSIDSDQTLHVTEPGHGLHWFANKPNEGVQWLSGRVLDSRPKGRGFEPHRRHCVVVLEQDTFILA